MPQLTSFEEFIEGSMTAKVIDMHNPKCIDCNDCCSLGTLLTKEEYKSLKKYFEKDKKGKQLFKESVDKLNKYARQGIMYFMCPLSSNLKRCQIYNKRPSMCKEFHCSSELAGKDYDKFKYALEMDEHYTMYDLFSNHMESVKK